MPGTVHITWNVPRLLLYMVENASACVTVPESVNMHGL